MQLEHEFTVPAPIETAWETMMDLQGVAECFPGATVTSAEGDSFEGTVKVKLGPIALVYKGSGTFVERDDGAHRAVIEAKGRDKRGNGTAGATATISMEPEGDSATHAKVVTDLNVTGKPAQFGRGVMQDVSDKLLGQFVDCLEKRLGGDGATEEDATESLEAAPTGASISAPTGETADGPAGSAADPSRVAAPSFGDDTLDLGSAVLPTVLRSYGPYAVAAAVGLVLGIVVGRRLK